MFAYCFENGAAFNWSLSSDQDLSIEFLNYSQIGWFLSGNCTYQNDTDTYLLVKYNFI